MSVAVLDKKFTYEDYRNFEADDNYLYELINGILVKKSAPSPLHQDASGNLYSLIRQFILEKKLGKVYYSPIDVFLDDYNVPQPDLVFISKNNLQIITNDGIMGIPDLVVEIISPSSISRDRYTKYNLYERFGIPEYWLLDVKNQSLEIFILKDKKYELFEFALEGSGKVKSKAIKGFKMDIEAIFS